MFLPLLQQITQKSPTVVVVVEMYCFLPQCQNEWLGNKVVIVSHPDVQIQPRFSMWLN